MKFPLLVSFPSEEVTVSFPLSLSLLKVIFFGIIFSVNRLLVSQPDFKIVSIGRLITEAVRILEILRIALTINHVKGTMSIPVTSFGSIVFIS